MAEGTGRQETFAEFKKSFFYGSRHNPNFKFIKDFSEIYCPHITRCCLVINQKSTIFTLPITIYFLDKY